MSVKIRKYHYANKSERKGAASSRVISGENLTKALDRALDLYKKTWGDYQDVITLTYSGTYTFN